MKEIILFLLYVLEITKYYLGYAICFNEKGKRYWIPVIGGVTYIVILFCARNAEDSLLRIIMYALPLVVMFFVHWKRNSAEIFRLFVLFFIITCIGEIFLTLSDLMFMKSKYLPEENLQHLVINSLVLAIIYIVYILKNNLRENQIIQLKEFAQKNILLVVLLMVIELMLTVTGLNWAREQIDNSKFQTLAIVLCGLSYMSIGMLGIFSVYMDRTNRKIENMMETEVMLKQLQKQYYDALLEREDDTRKYRHDMVNHLICLERFAKEKNVDLIQNYIGQMSEQLEEIHKRCYATGNDILDILTNHYVALLGENVVVHVSGCIHTSIDEMKLCTIYANLMQNAVEELQRCKEDAELDIKLRQGKHYAEISIRNSLANINVQNKGEFLLETQKPDKKNHGLGLRNVRRTIDEVGGKLELKNEKNYFSAIVTLKNE